MIEFTDLPDVLPVFPLSGAVLLPRARLPLNIFEPRYREMLEEALRAPQRLVGMVQPFDKADENHTGLHRIGCAGRVTQFSEIDGGRYLVTLTGVSRFKIKEELDSETLFRNFHVDWGGFRRDLGVKENDPGFDRSSFLKLLGRYFEAKKLDVEWETLREADDEMLINSLSMLLDLQGGEKQALLEAEELGGRREILETFMDYTLRNGASEEMIQ